VASVIKKNRMKIKNLPAVVLESLVVFALTLPVMAQSTTESTTTTQEPQPAQTQSTTTTTSQEPAALPPAQTRSTTNTKTKYKHNKGKQTDTTTTPPPRTNWGESVLMFPGRRRDRAFDGAPLKLLMLGWDFCPRWRNATPTQNDVWTLYPEELLWDIGAGFTWRSARGATLGGFQVAA
jgi:hypothetical protein